MVFMTDLASLYDFPTTSQIPSHVLFVGYAKFQLTVCDITNTSIKMVTLKIYTTGLDRLGMTRHSPIATFVWVATRTLGNTVLEVGDFLLTARNEVRNVFFCMIVALLDLFLLSLGTQQLSKKNTTWSLYWKNFTLWTQVDHFCWLENAWISAWIARWLFPGFLYLSDNRDRIKSGSKKDWLVREEIASSMKNIQVRLLVEISNRFSPTSYQAWYYEATCKSIG